MATRSEQYEEWAAERVTMANMLIRAGETIDSPLVDGDLERAAELLSRINGA